MDGFNSVVDTIKERATNPFFATLIGVWIFRNWNLPYTLLNFDNGTKLITKQKFIQNYFEKQSFLEELLINIGISLCLVTLAFILLVITRVIINIANHRITPFLNSKTVSKLVVNNNRFQTVKKQRDDFFRSLEDAQETIINLEQKNTLLRTENTELDLLKDENSRLKIDVSNLENTRKVILEDLKISGNESSSLSNEISQLKYNSRKLNWERNLLEDIFLTEYLNYESLPESERVKVQKKIPPALTKPFDALITSSELMETLQIVQRAEENPFEDVGEINIEDAAKLQKLNLISLYENSQGFKLDNLELTPLAHLIQRLELPLRQNWNDENLPF